jgi:hypothetical protein
MTHRIRTLAAVLFSLPALPLSTANAQDPSPANGGFETGTLLDGGFTAPDSWTRTGSQSGYVSSAPYLATEGTRLLVFSPGTNSFDGAISQTIPTAPGGSFTISLDAGIIGTAGKRQRLGIVVSDQSGILLSRNTDITGPTRWTNVTAAFTTASGQVTLSIEDRSEELPVNERTDADLVLDHVRVESGPVPGTPPSAVADSYTARRNEPLEIKRPGVLANDTDAESSLLTASVVTEPQHGSLVLAPDGGLLYIPDTGFTGADSFTYRASDGMMESQAATASLTVDNPPALAFANGGFEQGTPGTTDSPAGWSATGNARSLEVSGSYTATEGTRVALFNGGNDTHGSTLSQTFATVPGTRYRIDLQAGILGLTGSRQRLLVTLKGNNLLLYATTDRTAVSGPATWVPVSHAFIADSTATTLSLHDFSATIGGTAAVNSDLLVDGVVLTTLAPNAVPVAAEDVHTAAPEPALEIPAPGVLGNDTDADAQGPLSAILETGPSRGTLQLAANGGFSYLPDPGFLGTDSFTYRCSDGFSASPPVLVRIIVAAPRNLMANGSFESGNEGDPARPRPGSWSTTGSPFVHEADPSHSATDGSRMLVFNGGDDSYGGTASQTLTTIPGRIHHLYLDTGIFGLPDKRQRIRIRILGATTLLDQTIDLSAAEGPTRWSRQFNSFVADAATVTLELTDASGTLPGASASFSDLLVDRVLLFRNDPARAIRVDSSQAATVINSSPADLTGQSSGTTPFVLWYRDREPVELSAPPQAGTLTFRQWSRDGTAAGSQPVLAMTADADTAVTAQYAAGGQPLATPDTFAVRADASRAVAAPGLLANDTDPGGSALSSVLISFPKNGTVDLRADGSFSYVPNPGFTGTDSFTYRARNSTLESDPAAVTLEVSASAPTTFGAWLASHGLPASTAADPDRDTVANAFEYLTGGNPATGPDAGRLPKAERMRGDPDGDGTISSYVSLSCPLAQPAAIDPGLQVFLQYAADPAGPWTRADAGDGLIVIAGPDPANPGSRQMTFHLPENGRTRLFVRLTATITPGSP